MTFKKNGIVVTAFQIVGAFTFEGHRLPADCWIVDGWTDVGERAVMTNEGFHATFGHPMHRQVAA